jgi:hypothetical protein
MIAASKLVLFGRPDAARSHSKVDNSGLRRLNCRFARDLTERVTLRKDLSEFVVSRSAAEEKQSTMPEILG